ncbi:MAG TPA: right-handed parallel beta-helix repeat-containing protein, partial [Thermoanaerobaculia bacterium]
LRNLSINGAGNGVNGVRFLAGKSVVLDNVTISGFTTRGISVALAAAGDVFVKNSHITKCGVGVFASTSAGLARVSIENSSIVGNTTNGIEGSTNSRINVSNSVISGNGTNGVLANSATTRIALTTSQVSFNVTGINASVAGSITRLSDNDIFNNDTGVDIVAGTIETAGNNRVAGNGVTDPLPPPAIVVE